MLTEHDDGSVTLTDKRSHVCLEAAWELDALADRIRTLASILMAGLGDELEKTDDLERELKVTG